MFFLMRKRGSRRIIALQLALFGTLVVATFVFHLNGTTMMALRAARILLILGIVVVPALMRRRGTRSRAADSSLEPSAPR